MKRLICLAFLMLLGNVFLGNAQNGFLIGTINDKEFNDVLPFANVLVKGSTNGATSDFDGKYSLELTPGVYTVVFSYIGYQTKEITEVVIKSGEETIVDVTLGPLAQALDEVVVVTTVSKNTEASVLNLQKKSVALVDGLSLQSIKRVGASNIASAVRSVPGVSVQGGKFVFVRGLGDRYTKTLLNNLEVPGLDPDRNTLQLDIFPTNLLDNLIVVKSFTADQSADFTGGIVDIVTKDFPTKKEHNISVGGSYNSNFHFNNQFQTFNSGGRALGFANNANNVPFTQDISSFTPVGNTGQLRALTQSFDPQMGLENSTSSFDSSFGFSFGNQFNLNKDATWRIGYLAAISYRNESEFFENFVDGQVYRRSQDNSVLELQLDRSNSGNLSTNNTLLTGLGGITVKGERSKFKLNLLHIQNGETQSSFTTLENLILNSNLSERTALLFTERAISNASLNGIHSLGNDASWTIDWKGNVTLASVLDQDFRVTPFFLEPSTGQRFINPSETGDPLRIWRDLEEINIAGKIDISKRHKIFGNDAKVKFGTSYITKNREFGIDQFAFPNSDFDNEFSIRFDGDPDQILAPDNILINRPPREGTFVRQNSNPSDSFDSDINILGLYVSEELKFTKWFNAILGVRVEQFQLDYTGVGVDGTEFNEERFIEEFDVFPTANLIFELDEEGNKKIRASYGRTTARPSFKEASTAAIIDPVAGTIFNGNPDIRPTYINNFDLRYEIYGESNNFIAISSFYKTFENPIEISFIQGAPNQFIPLNLGEATVIGLELELRKSLDFIGLKDFFFNGNYSIIDSRQDFGVFEQERRSDPQNLRDGETPLTERQLQGQAPYILNLGFNYNNQESGWESGLFFNVQGSTLEIVSDGNVGDVFTRPFNDLRFNLGKTFGQNKQNKISFRMSNILNDEVLSEFESFGSSNQIFSLREPGQTFSLSYSTKF